jgi:hypothetical protein
MTPKLKFISPWGGNSLLVQQIPNPNLNETEKTLCALALFVLKFARVESSLLMTLRRLSGVSNRLVRGIANECEFMETSLEHRVCDLDVING